MSFRRVRLFCPASRAGSILAGAVLCLIAIGLCSTASAQPENSQRHLWDLPDDFPVCHVNDEPAIAQFACFPDFNPPGLSYSLVMGRIRYQNGDVVKNHQFQGPAATIEMLHGLDDLVAVSQPLGSLGMFWAIYSYPAEGPDDLFASAEHAFWVFAESHLGLGTPFPPSRYSTPLEVNPFDDDYYTPDPVAPVFGGVTDLGTINLPSPPRSSVKCAGDPDGPDHSMRCEAKPEFAGSTHDVEYLWFFPDGTPYFGPVAKQTLASDAPVQVEFVADAGDGWGETLRIQAAPTLCTGPCLAVDVTTQPANLVRQGEPAIVTATVTNTSQYRFDGITAMVTNFAVLDGGSTAPFSLAPFESRLLRWQGSFPQANFPGTVTEVGVGVVARHKARTETAAGVTTVFVEGPSLPVQVSVDDPLAVGGAADATVLVQNPTGDTLTNVRVTSITVTALTVDAFGNQVEGGQIDYSGPLPDPKSVVGGELGAFVIPGIATRAGHAAITVTVTAHGGATDYVSGAATSVDIGESVPQPAPLFVPVVVPEDASDVPQPYDPPIGDNPFVGFDVTNQSVDQALHVEPIVSTAEPGVALQRNFDDTFPRDLEPGETQRILVSQWSAVAPGAEMIHAQLRYSFDGDTNATFVALPIPVVVIDPNAKQPQTIDFDPLSDATVGDPARSVAPTASSGLAVTVVSNSPSICSVTGGGPYPVTILTSGVCVLTANQAGDATWEAAPAVTRGFTIAKAAQTISFGPLDDHSILEGSILVPSATSSSGLSVTVQVLSSTNGACQGGGLGIAFNTIGTCTLRATQAGNRSYDAATPVDVTFTITPSPDALPQTIDFPQPADITWGDPDAPLALSIDSGQTIDMFSTGGCTAFDNGGWTIRALFPGSCTLTASQVGDGIHYLPATPVSWMLQVKKRPVTITALDVTAAPGDPFNVGYGSFSVSGTINGDGPQNFGGASACTSTAAVTAGIVTGAPGTYPIQCFGWTSTNYVVTQYVDGTLTVTGGGGPQAQSIAFTQPPDLALGDPPLDLEATASSGLPVSFASETPTVCTVSDASVTAVAIGTCSVTASQAGNAAYLPASATRSLQVHGGPLAQLVISPATATIVAGGAQSYTARGFDALGNDLGDLTASTVFTIAPDGACTDDSCSATIAGAHEVTGTSGGMQGTASLTATPAAIDHLVLTPAIASVAVGAKATFAAHRADAFGNDLGDVTAAATFTVAGGTCTREVCKVKDLGPHLVTATAEGLFGTATLRVGKKQRITFRTAAKATLPQSPLALSATASSDLPVHFTSQSPDVCVTGGTDGSTLTLVAPGRCTIAADQEGDDTYAPATTVTKSFTVALADQKITVTPVAKHPLGDASVHVTATSSSGLPVTLTSLSPTICTISPVDPALVLLQVKGSCSIQADQNGNALYAPAKKAKVTFKVT